MRNNVTVRLVPVKCARTLEAFFARETHTDGFLESIKGDVDDLRYIDEGELEFYHFFSIFVEKTMIGYLAINQEMPERLEHLYVTPAFRRCGYARAAVNQLRICEADVLPKNQTAKNFYRRLGFMERTLRRKGQQRVTTLYDRFYRHLPPTAKE